MLKNRVYSAVFALSLLACAGSQALGISSNNVFVDGTEYTAIANERGLWVGKCDNGADWLDYAFREIPTESNGKLKKTLGTPVSIALSSNLEVALGYKIDDKRGAVLEFYIGDNSSGGLFSLPPVEDSLEWIDYAPYFMSGLVGKCKC